MINFIKNNKLFVRMTGINFLSKIGDNLFYTAMLSAAILLPNSKLAVLIVSISESLPILISIFFGVIADKQKGKINQLIGSSLFRSLMYICIGIIFRYPQSLLLLLLASFMNLLSDISGNYATALFSPFTKAMIAPQDMETAQGFVSVGTQLVAVFATFIGSLLLTIYSKSMLAIINASIFLLIAFLYYLLKPSLKAQGFKIKSFTNTKTLSIVKENLTSFISNHSLLINLIQLAMLNGFFGGQTPLFALFIEENNQLNILSNPFKIALLSGIITLSMILGSSLTTYILKKQSIFHINILSDCFIVIIAMTYLYNNIWGILVGNSCLAFLLGIVSPRFSANVINQYPVDRLGGVITVINAFLVIIPPLTSVIFPMISTINLKLAYICFIAYALILIIISVLINKMAK
ncbi:MULTISPECIES: MFS transporter [Aerococcus]|uniref:MFS transporter n=3 Tax=Aerococcus TaxID=1375 RepID=A0A178HED7_9LACT|nr:MULTISPECIES: MFS transporter [Aerococcus]KAA9221102.1 MFS transporter [Aerococcus loyolae]MCY3025400.1 MFS transporter [Aerococcus loyolae]MCY3026655.1 MFS transporter [Aerococcus loyolae]MCY3028238.1 MFS transporter [Aerococcus loyolae]MDK6257312.1 MFS transporter [Aerococcus urinae]